MFSLCAKCSALCGVGLGIMSEPKVFLPFVRREKLLRLDGELVCRTMPRQEVRDVDFSDL